MAEYLNKDELVSSIKKTYCTGCRNYSGTLCRACDIGETLGVIDDTPTVAALDPDTRENNPFAEEGVIACQVCRSGEWLYNEDGAPNAFCGQCGHRITWPEASEEAAARRAKK